MFRQNQRQSLLPYHNSVIRLTCVFRKCKFSILYPSMCGGSDFSNTPTLFALSKNTTQTRLPRSAFNFSLSCIATTSYTSNFPPSEYVYPITITSLLLSANEILRRAQFIVALPIFPSRTAIPQRNKRSCVSSASGTLRVSQ